MNGIMHSGNSSAAVDGNVMAQGPNQTCTHTADHIGKTWWQVDLGDIYFITDVKILIFLRGIYYDLPPKNSVLCKHQEVAPERIERNFLLIHFLCPLTGPDNCVIRER